MTDDTDTERRSAVLEPVDVEPFDPLSSAAALEIAAMSVCGRLRPHNTDHFLAIRVSRGLETVVTSLAEADHPPDFEEYGYALAVSDVLAATVRVLARVARP